MASHFSLTDINQPLTAISTQSSCNTAAVLPAMACVWLAVQLNQSNSLIIDV